jgi:hypothetical protein
MPVWQPEASVHAAPETQAGEISLGELPPQADAATSAAKTENEQSDMRI